MNYIDVCKMMKQATWLGRRVNDVFGHDTAIGRAFGESNDTAAQNFYNQQIKPETVAQRKQLASQYDAEYAKERNRVNAGVDKAVALEQQRSQAAQNQQLAKQRAQDAYINQLAAQRGVQLNDAQRAAIRSRVQTPQAVASKPATTVPIAATPAAKPAAQPVASTNPRTPHAAPSTRGKRSAVYEDQRRAQNRSEQLAQARGQDRALRSGELVGRGSGVIGTGANATGYNHNRPATAAPPPSAAKARPTRQGYKTPDGVWHPIY